MAGSAGGFLLANYAGYILQVTHSYASLFAIAASAYLVAFAVIQMLAPGLRRVESLT
jgi:ACS family hexuronate transporter-like MFS transporter